MIQEMSFDDFINSEHCPANILEACERLGINVYGGSLAGSEAWLYAYFSKVHGRTENGTEIVKKPTATKTL